MTHTGVSFERRKANNRLQAPKPVPFFGVYIGAMKNQRIIYFDNAATTRVRGEVAGAVSRLMTEEYGNPSSLHTMGLRAEHIVNDAKSIIAGSLRAKESEIIFTSGGTESNNTALFGAVDAKKRYGRHILVGSTEHPSVLRAAEELERVGCTVIKIPCDAAGILRLDFIEQKLREDPEIILVSTMLVNNEVGSVQPVEDIAKVVKIHGKNALYHVDAVQAYGKMTIRPGKWGVDLMSVSGHKFHGPKGVGFLYIRDGVRIKPYICGGGQQKNMRSGTEDVFGIHGMALAAKIAVGNIDANYAKVKSLATKLDNGLKAFKNVEIHSKSYQKFPYILSVSFPGIRSEVLLHALDERGICVSSGSACAANDKHTSDTLKAMGLKPELIDSTIRFSFSDENEEEEVEYLLEVLGEIVPKLGEFIRY